MLGVGTKLGNISIPYATRKGRIFYFVRRVPGDLSALYTAPKIVFSLRTACPKEAARRAAQAALQLDDFWFRARLARSPLPGHHLLAQPARAAVTVSTSVETIHQGTPASSAPLLSEAIQLYVQQKGKGRSVTFGRHSERSCGYLIDFAGDLPITAYTRAQANGFRDKLLKKKLVGSSIARVLGTIRATMNYAAAEHAIDFNNPFRGIQFDKAEGISERRPVPIASIRRIQAECRTKDDEMRWLVALVADTGLRLAEAAGLAMTDICTGKGVVIPHILVQPHPWRPLKTPASRRKVVLVGSSYWAASRIKETAGRSQAFAFPRYNRDGKTNSGSASAALGKWLRAYVPDGCTMHSLRHSLRDRLRAVECPADLQDAIGGWHTPGIGHTYGDGFPLEVFERWMKKIE